MTHHTFSSVSEALPKLSAELLSQPETPSRNGSCRELRHQKVTITNPLDREILLPGRKASYAAQIAETMWVLSGRDDIEWLSRYLPRAPDFSDDGLVWRGAYGPRIRSWRGVDQLSHVVDLLQKDPYTRRAVISIYDPEVDSLPGKDIPCNNWLHFTNRGGLLDLHVVARSNDLVWGWSGINAFEWSVLLEVVAGMTGTRVGEIHFSISSLHVYRHHYGKAEKLSESAPEPPHDYRAALVEPTVQGLDQELERWFYCEERIREIAESDFPALEQVDEALSCIEHIRSPLFRMWLHVLAAHWQVRPLPYGMKDTRYDQALKVSPRKREAPPVPPETPESRFLDYVDALHTEKHAAYGDSWCRRGEQMSIIANIARKVDRLGVDGAGDTSTDTAVDLLVYLAKYVQWLRGESSDPEAVSRQLRKIRSSSEATHVSAKGIVHLFNHVLVPLVDSGSSEREAAAKGILDRALFYAEYLWLQENHAARNIARQWNPEG